MKDAAVLTSPAPNSLDHLGAFYGTARLRADRRRPASGKPVLRGAHAAAAHDGGDAGATWRRSFHALASRVIAPGDSFHDVQAP